MSIIHDALKKVQAQTLNKQPQTVQPAELSASNEMPRPLAIGLIVTLSVLIIIVLSVLIKLTMNSLHRTKTINPKQAAILPAAPDISIASIRIEGIMETNGKKVALVNGNIYEEGQTIGHYTITAITSQNMIISDGKTEVTLPAVGIK